MHSELRRATLNVAHELSLCASTSDGAVILAPQGLDYIAAFLGALQAGLIAVPLSAPMGGAHDGRVHSEYGKVAPPGTNAVSWLPFHHDLVLQP